MLKRLAVLLIALLLTSVAGAAGLGLNLQGRILKPDSTPVVGNSVQFKIQIRSPGAENCLLFEEAQTLDMTGSSGVFSLNVGNGARSAAGIDGGYSLDRIFANRGLLDLSATAPSACAIGTSYSPAVADSRLLVYSFNDGGGWQNIPSVSISWVPLALEALQVGGYKSSNLLRVADVSGNPQAAPTLLPTDVTELVALLNGTAPGMYNRVQPLHFLVQSLLAMLLSFLELLRLGMILPIKLTLMRRLQPELFLM